MSQEDDFAAVFKNAQKKKEEDCPQIICKKDPFKKYRKTTSHLVNIDKLRATDENNNTQNQDPEHNCPLTRETLGRYTWSLLHTIAAYYPQKPEPRDQTAAKGILEGLRDLYPCRTCRGHFQKDYERDPPNLDSPQEFRLWVCRQHNYVNKILGKPQFECTEQNLQKRWKYGCQEEEEEQL